MKEKKKYERMDAMHKEQVCMNPAHAIYLLPGAF